MATPSQTDWAQEKADELWGLMSGHVACRKADVLIIAAALRAERERCAEIADKQGEYWGGVAAKNIAIAIREGA